MYQEVHQRERNEHQRRRKKVKLILEKTLQLHGEEWPVNIFFNKNVTYFLHHLKSDNILQA